MDKNTDPEIAVKSFENFLASIQTAVGTRKNEPAFTFILGSGFSDGLVPTAWEMTMYDIPWWLHGEWESFKRPPRSNEAFEAARRELWRKIHSKQHSGGEELPKFEVDESGLPIDTPDNIAHSYQAIMKASDGLSSSELRHDYLKAAIRRCRNEINYAHLYLAGILQAQYTDAWRKEYGHRRPFCSTVFTTNFDTLLQRALQLNNQIFFVSDEPEHYCDQPQDDHGAVHIIQAHGSIFRPFLANTEKDIEKLRDSMSGSFVEYFQKRGVIVLGYGGWDDALMQALTNCRNFQGNLYWCDIHDKDDAKSKLRSNVLELLQKHNDHAFYVPLPRGGANIALREIHKTLGLGNYPKALIHPLDSLIGSIESLRLPEELPTTTEERKEEESSIGAIKNLGDLDNAQIVKEGVLSLLYRYQLEFEKPTSPEGKNVLARSMALSGKLPPAIRLWSEVVENQHAQIEQKAEAYFNRGVARKKQGDTDGAIDDYIAILDMQGASSEYLAVARHNLGFIKEKQGDTDEAIADYTTVIGMQGISVKHIASAQFNRGVARKKQGDISGAIADYTAVIEMRGALPNQVLKAQHNRGALRSDQGDISGAIEDFNAVLKLDGATEEQKIFAKELLDQIQKASKDEEDC